MLKLYTIIHDMNVCFATEDVNKAIEFFRNKNLDRLAKYANKIPVQIDADLYQKSLDYWQGDFSKDLKYVEIVEGAILYITGNLS